MRAINVSTDVYAAIWSARQSGEDTESQILTRLLNIAPEEVPENNGPDSARIGFSVPRFAIELPEGFEIFRVYQGQEYRARARDGKWELLGTERSYPSLNQLSRGVGAGTENAWQNWYYTGSDGKRALVSGLRKAA